MAGRFFRTLWTAIGRDHPDASVDGNTRTPELPFHHAPPQGEAKSPNSNEYRIPDEIEQELQSLPHSQQIKAREKIKEYRDAIQPHTDEGGDAHYIGDAYEDVNPQCEREWAVECPGAYLKYVQELSKELPHLEYLALWMLVGCSPPKWRFLKDLPDRRAHRVAQTNVSVIDYRQGHKPRATPFNNSPDLLSALEDAEFSGAGTHEVRLLVVEDLSRDLIETLGSHYDIDPLFFLSHIGDYLFHNTHDRWAELSNLDADAREQTHFNLQYLRPRYFANEIEFKEAEKQSGLFNVLRRLDSDRSRKALQSGLLRRHRKEASITLMRAKSSLWVKPSEPGKPITAILLVDPTVKSGRPLWGGYRPFAKTPSMSEWQKSRESDAPPRDSLFADVVHWSCRITDEDLKRIKKDPKCIAIPMIKLVIADWLTVLKYMTTVFGIIEWTFEKPHWGDSPDDISNLLKKLSPWRRNVGYYQRMVDDAINRLFPTIAAAYPSTPADVREGFSVLGPDFKNIKQLMDEHKARIASIQTMATNAVNTEEARRAVKQNKNLARLTFLATFFIPLSFTSSFLSMSPDFVRATQTIWLFFALGIPITLAAFFLVDWTKPGKKGITRQWWRKISKREDAQDRQQDPPNVFATRQKKAATFPWPYARANSSFMMK